MSNRETYPASQSPLAGDISGAAGQTLVTVVGIQTVPVDPTLPTDQQKLVYEASTGMWTPATDANESIQVNGIPISDDYDIGVNLILGTTNSPVLINGA